MYIKFLEGYIWLDERWLYRNGHNVFAIFVSVKYLIDFQSMEMYEM